jgi:hypothetical protein
MKKITLLFLATILTFVISSCSKTEEVAPPTVVGIWKVGGLGVITDTKTVDVTTAEIKKLDAKAGEGFEGISYEFKADGTSISSKKSGTSIVSDAGKYVLSADKKLLTITSDKEKDSKGNAVVQSFEIVSLTTSELKFGLGKLSKKGADGKFIIDLLSADFATYLLSVYVFAAKGLDPEKENTTAKTLTSTYNLKK